MGGKATGGLTFRDILARGEDMARATRLGERAAKSAIPVLLEGETGVGKESMARAIHGASERRGKPFVVVNCAALPGNLADSLLFGHEKGAFAGAAEKNAGKFAEAGGGVLFLDEVGELPLETQFKMLRVLQDREIEPAGARRPARVDARVIAATSQNLIERVKRGLFREDLYYRLNVFPIALPPLRARRADIADLARRFLARFAAEEGKRLRGLSAEALALLATYDWPGNVRQLENALFRAVVLAEGDELTVAEFPQIAAHVQGFGVRVPPAPAPVGAREVQREIVRVEVRDPNSIKLLNENGDVQRLDWLEERAIRFALAHYRGQMSEMARKLGIGRSTLYRKMKELGLAETIAGDGADAA
jgi:DNA-binding NtrC family response regulator